MNYSASEKKRIHDALAWLRAAGYFAPDTETGRDAWVHVLQQHHFDLRDILAGVQLLAGDCTDTRILPPHLCMYAARARDARIRDAQQTADRAESERINAELKARRDAETPEEAECEAAEMRRQFDAMIRKAAVAKRP